MGLNPLNAASWAGLYRSNPPAPPSAQEWQEAAGAFFIPDAFENQSHCSALGSTCRRGEDLLCGFLVDSPSNECVALGQDVAAKRNGGSIDYALTSGGVSHGALLLSHLLQNVASFAMPELRYADPPISPPLSAASNTAATRLLQSYYPLYNHTNDPGVLISDSNATYAIHDNHGQVTIALAHGSPVFAVAMETATTDPEGRCESVEIRWFSVYVQLEGEENTACRKALPSQDTLTKMADGDEHWCRVGRFEYRCQRKGSLQVFCLQRPSGEREEPPPWASKGSVACRNGKAWQTQRVRIVLNGNWGAGATRIRRLRVLAFPESPYFYKE
ncbi:hypothetical protein, conserved [Eimeria praecox]|uniref:Uncharacterized protein n=1 Tax=Eimeria praecox TaxID=51316 RepID=U6GEA7_9EIME|nr:hypothetical protein, conserved [Eimeria praecox]